MHGNITRKCLLFTPPAHIWMLSSISKGGWVHRWFAIGNWILLRIFENALTSLLWAFAVFPQPVTTTLSSSKIDLIKNSKHSVVSYKGPSNYESEMNINKWKHSIRYFLWLRDSNPALLIQSQLCLLPNHKISKIAWKNEKFQKIAWLGIFTVDFEAIFEND